MVAFIRQYQYNTNIGSDRTQLQNMSKKEHESFKEYAQRWRDLAAQVAPPMMEREMITMIVDTLPVFYYEKMVSYIPSSFADLIFAGERIEVGLRRGKFDYAAPASASNRRFEASGTKKKEGDTHAVTSAPTWPKSQQTLTTPLTNIPHTNQASQPTSETLPIWRPSNKGCPLNHKGLLHKTHSPHNLVPSTTPIPAQAPICEGIFQ